jgi:hypothetical protein
MTPRPFLPLFLAIATSALAEPTWQKELTSSAPGNHPALPPSSLDLQVSWKGMIDSGKIHLEFAPKNAKKPGAYVVRTSATSIGAAASLFPYQSNFWSEVDPTSLKPRYFHAVEADAKESVTTTTRHFSDRVECAETTRLIKKGTELQQDRVFKFSPTFDIFSAMLHVRSQKLDDGDQITIVVHPFGTPYLLRVKVLGHETHLERKAIKLSLGMRKIDRTTLELKAYKKLKSDATLWLSDDEARIPIEFRAAVFIGDVRATLTGFRKN